MQSIFNVMAIFSFLAIIIAIWFGIDHARHT